jgi:hypothetical protein
MRTWEPCIPGTDIDRISLIVELQTINRDPLSTSVYRTNAILKVARYGLFSTPQIGRLVGCGTRAVTTVLDTLNIDPVNTKGRLDPKALPGLLLVCTRLAAGVRPERVIMAELTKHVSPGLMEKLTGVPPTTFTYYRKKATA